MHTILEDFEHQVCIADTLDCPAVFEIDAFVGGEEMDGRCTLKTFWVDDRPQTREIAVSLMGKSAVQRAESHAFDVFADRHFDN